MGGEALVLPPLLLALGMVWAWRASQNTIESLGKSLLLISNNEDYCGQWCTETQFAICGCSPPINLSSMHNCKGGGGGGGL